MPDAAKTCPDCGAPIPDGSAWCPKCGANLRGGRDGIVAVGMAIRQAQERAQACPELTGRDLRVLLAVIALVASYSRLQDALSVGQISEAAGVEERNTGRSLARLRERGIIVRDAGRGGRGRAGQVGLPAAEKPWPATAPLSDQKEGPATATLSPGNPGQSRPETLASYGPPPEETSEKTAAREAEPASAPAGSAGGRPAQVAEIPNTPVGDVIRRAMRRQQERDRQLELAVEPGRGDELAARAGRSRAAPPPPGQSDQEAIAR